MKVGYASSSQLKLERKQPAVSKANAFMGNVSKFIDKNQAFI